jgi:protein-S-isoprenylcysteine O-methyltransferase Ste14/uncharacterized protein YndB with AHSA1/START domain
LLLPGTVLIWVPLWLATLHGGRLELGTIRWVGVPVLVIGVAGLLWCIWDFGHRGRGTLAPVDPPRFVVHSGLYRVVRNPMYVSVLVTLIGEAVVFRSARFIAWAAIVALVVHVFVVAYEEPTLRRQFGASYGAYCREVSRWLPRVWRHAQEGNANDADKSAVGGEQQMPDHDVTVTRTVHADADRVWAALTQPDLVKQWMMGAEIESTWEPGALITWSGEYNGQTYEDKGEILEIDAGKRLVHTHFSPMSGAEDRPENYHRLSWDLAEDNGSTKLTLTQSGASSAEQAEQFEANWRNMLDSLREVAEAG